MKRLFTVIATHTAALLLGFSIAFFTAHLDRPRVVQDEGAVSNTIYPLGEIVDIDKLYKTNQLCRTSSMTGRLMRLSR